MKKEEERKKRIEEQKRQEEEKQRKLAEEAERKGQEERRKDIYSTIWGRGQLRNDNDASASGVKVVGVVVFDDILVREGPGNNFNGVAFLKKVLKLKQLMRLNQNVRMVFLQAETY